ncbi:membrane protein [Pseudomonas oryzihabitans]|nr:membrane protein [Pseudomonas psychrotolerans]KTT39064.1 membrane protein [Pseudomonas psychrotolerans]KTT47235.1 membrane protein [Pseudomonas psychrotolerans]
MDTSASPCSAPRLPTWLPLLGAFFALYVIWGSTYLVIRLGIAHWPPLLMAGLRFTVAGLLMLGWLRWRGAPWPNLRETLAAGVIGILLLGVGNGGVTLAEHWGVTSGVAALAIATVPLFTLLFGLLWGQRNTLLEWAGIALGLVGIALLNLGDTMSATPLGAAVILLAAAAWAFGSIWSRYLPMPRGAMASAVEMLVAGAALLLASRFSGEQLQQWPTLGGWLALGYLVVFGSLIAFSAYLYLLGRVRPAAATSYAYVNPVVAVLLGTLFAGERIGPAEMLAMLVIVGAVVLIGVPQWRRR